MPNTRPAYVYPLNNPEDVLYFDLFPDQMSQSFGSHGGSHAMPSLSHHINQRTGRKSPTFKYSLLFDEVEDDGVYGSAQKAYEWIQTYVGPHPVSTAQRGSQVFVLKVVSGPRLVTLDQVDITVQATWHSGEVRRCKVDLSGEEFFPIVIDPGLFRIRKKKKKQKAGEEKKPIIRMEPETIEAAAIPIRPMVMSGARAQAESLVNKPRAWRRAWIPNEEGVLDRNPDRTILGFKWPRR